MLASIPSGASVFLDANILVFHFGAHPDFGPECSQLIRRIQAGDVLGHTSTRVLGEMAHRLMVLEAKAAFGWSSKVPDKLKRQPGLLRQLTHFQTAVDDVLHSRINVLTIPPPLIGTAAGVSLQHGLLTNDALFVAAMQQHALVNIASGDADFDRVPGITRYGPM